MEGADNRGLRVSKVSTKVCELNEIVEVVDDHGFLNSTNLPMVKLPRLKTS